MPLKKTKTLMIQGTGSNVGKSILTTALCRIFLEDGFSVAPFKVQNMALNAYVTSDGFEMSRAQALQAQACRIEPDVRMNPVLIKPTTVSGSQVVVMGKAREILSWADYTALKPQLWPTIRSAYQSLSFEHDVIVLEGAGSPAEINLMENDIVNMSAAEMADAPVLLAGDIDAGGVFASFVGTLSLLPPHQASRIKGFILNKFRGDRLILEPGLAKIQQITGKPVLGVVPYLEELLLPEEDSVSFKTGKTPLLKKQHLVNGQPVCRIAILDLPKISNFTDFDPFYAEPDVEIQVVRRGDSLKLNGILPDVVIIPGSKNVAQDLAYLKETHLDREVTLFASKGGLVVGLCGGLQMLGETLDDPFGVENTPSSVSGLGFLKIGTILEKEKTLKKGAFLHVVSGIRASGFEMHHGRTTVCRERPCFLQEGMTQGNPLGWSNETGRIWGTYLHGVFDSDEFRRWFIDQIRENKGLPPLKKIQANYDTEKVIQRLANEVRKGVDMDAIYRMMQ
ncbi:MAG: cobyric acid synthase [Nitrospirae bacterium]|nr:cobyric acid synthase [Nitrospirota bacterium]MBI3352747.1 cobyric acid synthase [Nitrospirota bacterium]